MKTKEELIKEAWGGDMPAGGVDENGWSNKPFHQDHIRYNKYDAQQYLEGGYIRPKSLKGIEKNNGWIKIEYGLPKGDLIDCNLILSNGHMILNGGFRRYSEETYYFFNTKGEGFNINSVTHYQPIVKPLKPLY